VFVNENTKFPGAVTNSVIDVLIVEVFYLRHCLACLDYGKMVTNLSK
jgi:hypothetical protein